MNKVGGGDPDLCLLGLRFPTAHKVATEFSGECCQSQETARVLECSLMATRLEGHYRSSSCGVLRFHNILKPLEPSAPRSKRSPESQGGGVGHATTLAG